MSFVYTVLGSSIALEETFECGNCKEMYFYIKSILEKGKKTPGVSWEYTFISVVSPSHALSVVSGQIMCYARIVHYGIQDKSTF